MTEQRRQPGEIRLASHVHGYPFDPPRWAEQPRLRDKSRMAEGAGTVVAVLDSGFTRHPWLRGSYPEPLTAEQVDIWDLSGPALPSHIGHGTFVAGVVLQYAPQAMLLPRRVVNYEGSADDADLAAIIEDLREADPDVLNLSLGPVARLEPGEVDEGTERTLAAIRALQDNCGTVVVVAAGNSAERFPSEHIAPDDELTVVVGAHDLGGRPAWFSSRDSVQIWAPGVDVLSSFLYWDGLLAAGESEAHEHEGEQEDEHAHDEGILPIAPFGGWARWNGTSFAAPAVAGAIATEISRVRDVDDAKERRRLGLYQVLKDAHDIGVNGGTALALSALPVALQGPPVAY
jgi:subtilisin family serine protease